ncbi:MAG: alpha/beta fold hydrolase [Halioglobus sp.]|nr:alpha/beta fold hydrolase [Halioglobus sp.]
MDDSDTQGTETSLDDIIDGIYHVAVEPDRVSELVGTWRSRFKDAAVAAAAHERVETHLNRALDLLDRLHADAGGPTGPPTSSGTQPMLRVDHTNHISDCNTAATLRYGVRVGDTLDALPVCAASGRALVQALRKRRAEQGATHRDLNLIRLNRTDTGEALTLSIAPRTDTGDSATIEITGADIVCPDELRQVLGYTFELTATEVDVAAHLIEGLSVNNIAARRNNSVGTVRVHVRSLLAKSETHNQAEFIRMAIGIAAMLQPAETAGIASTDGPAAASDAAPYPRPEHRHVLALPEGRQLAYADFGPEDGRVVLFMHDNILGDTWPAELATAVFKNNLRVIAPARPHYCESTPYNPGSSPVDQFCDDVNFLLEQLGVSNFVLLSRTTGSGFAAAIALAHPAACRGLVALSPALPFGKSRDYDYLNDHARFVALSARFQKTALLFACRAGEALYRTTGTRRYLKTVLARSAPDRAVCDDPKRLPELQHGLDYQQNYKAFYNELLGLQSHPFPKFRDITCPVELIVGDLDSNNRRYQAEKFAAGLAGFTVTVIPNAGALFFYTHGETVLTALQRLSAQSPD